MTIISSTSVIGLNANEKSALKFFYGKHIILHYTKARILKHTYAFFLYMRKRSNFYT